MTFGDRLELRSGGRPLAATIEARPGWRALLPSWPLVLALAAFAETLVHPHRVLGDPDTYTHIAAGRWMFAHGALPAHDPFSYTKAGHRWVVHEWLSEIALAAAYDLAGWSGPVVLTGACFAASMAVLARLLLRWCEPFSALIAVLLAGELTLGHLLARPHMLALPLLVLWCGLLFRARDAGDGPPWRLLPVVTLWANLHASFMFGLALAAFLGGEAVLSPAAGASRCGEARRWGFFFLAALAAALLTPNGLAGLVQPFRLVAMPALHHILEWQGANFQHFQPLEIWLLGFAGLGFAAGFRLPPTRLILVLGLFHMTLRHVRYIEILGIVGPLAIAAPLGAQIAERMAALPLSAVTRFMRRLALPAPPPAGAAAVALAALFALPLVLSPVRRGNGAVTPARALAAAQRMGLPGKPVFNSYGFGGYLIFRGVPVFIDGRAELYGNAFLTRYLKAQQDRRTLAALLARYHVAWALVSRQDGASLMLDALPGWRRAYRDRHAIIAVRAAPRPAPLRPRPHFAGNF